MIPKRPSPEIAEPEQTVCQANAVELSGVEEPSAAPSDPALFVPPPQTKGTQTGLKFFGANLVGRGIATTLAELEEKIARHADDHFLSVVSCSITVDNETGQRPYYIAAVVFQKLS